MATSCPTGFDATRLRQEVSQLYGALARDPDADFHFHRGPHYAARALGYSAEALCELPDLATAPFAGVANPLAMGSAALGESVLDVGCGAGMDLLLAAKQVGHAGRAIGVDMTEAMRRLASSAAGRLGFTHVEVRDGDAEALPVDDGEVDLAISNGVLNLTTDKVRAFGEIFRALRPGGRLQFGDIVVGSELSESIRNDIDLWTS
jgi:arsenite methyltransferase